MPRKGGFRLWRRPQQELGVETPIPELKKKARIDGSRIYLRSSGGIKVVLMGNTVKKGSCHLPKLRFSHWIPE
ncbi:hypothetical protein Sjap_019545 [Stephania japonica]|uniref:Uncharacterized protein n=1 Tax=Stephania japonica TaxID=461633 RepID=A0AAP0EZ05_9MAGN